MGGGVSAKSVWGVALERGGGWRVGRPQRALLPTSAKVALVCRAEFWIKPLPSGGAAGAAFSLGGGEHMFGLSLVRRLSS